MKTIQTLGTFGMLALTLILIPLWLLVQFDPFIHILPL